MKTYEYVNFGLLGTLANAAGKVGGFFGNVGQGIGAGISNAANAVQTGVGNAVNAVRTGVGNTVNAVKTGVGNAVNAVKEDWNSMGSQLQSGYNDVRNGDAAQQQPAVASDGTVVKNENTPNFDDINEHTYDPTQNQTTNLNNQVIDKGHWDNSRTAVNNGTMTPYGANAKLDKTVAQTEADQAAATKAKEAAAARKAASDKAAQEKATAEAKNNMIQNTQAVSGMKAILRTINSGKPLTGPQINFLAQNGLQGDASQIQQWIQQHGG